VLLAVYLLLSWRANLAAGQTNFIDAVIDWVKLAVRARTQRQG